MRTASLRRSAAAETASFYASRETLARAARTFSRDLADYPLLSPEVEQRLNCRLHQLEPMQHLAVGPYSVMALPANHAPGTGAMSYAIEGDGRGVFYATDTATLLEPTWEAFQRHRLRFDLVILDHTYGPDQPDGDHLSARGVSEHAERLRAEGVLTPGGRVFATHIAHEGNPAHPDLDAFARAHGYEVAYDGLVLTI